MSLRSWAARRSAGLPPARTGVVASRVWMDTDDGARLATRLVRPADPSLRHGTVLIRSERPLGHGNPLEHIATWLAEDGRNVVLQNCRGRGASEGEFEPFVDEVADGAAVLAWLAKQPELEGPVVLVGLGYAAYTAWATAAHPDDLAGLAVGFGARDPYAWLHGGGILRLETALALAARLEGRDGIEPDSLDLGRAARHRPLRECDRVAVRTLPAYRTWLDHPERDAWWEARTPALVPAAKTLHFSGWGDPALPAILADHDTLVSHAASSALSIGPWGAIPQRRRDEWPSLRPMRAIAPTLLRFVADAVGESVPPVKTRVFVLGEGWQDARPWPPPRATERTLFLHSDGNANTSSGDGVLAPDAPGDEPEDAFVQDPADPAPSATRAGADPGARGDVLCFTAPTLEHPLELAGRVTANAFVAATTPFDLFARLVAVGADGAKRMLCESGVRRTEAATDAVEIDLGAVAARLRSGDRLRLEVAGAAAPRFAPSERHTSPARIALHHDAERPSALHFHAVGF